MMTISKEAQAKINAIAPKMKFVNCVAAISKMAQFGDQTAMCYIDYLNTLSQQEQQKIADIWEAQGFTHTNDFLNWLDSYGWTKVEENQ